MKKTLMFAIGLILAMTAICHCENKPVGVDPAVAGESGLVPQAVRDAAKMNVADSVLLGKVVTMDEKGTLAEAVAVKGTKIVFVGSKKDASQYIGPRTRVIDYENNYIYPGFIDGHSHLGLMATSSGKRYASLDMTKYLRETAADMKSFIAKHPGQNVYIGAGFWKFEDDPDPLTHETLDKYASDEVPVMMIDGGMHTALLNQKALEYFHIKDRISVYGTDGIKVDKNGEPTGVLAETVQFDILEELPISKDDLKEAYATLQNKYVAQGFVAMCDAGVVETELLPMVSAFNELAEEGRLKLKVRALYEISESNANPLAEVDKAIELSKKYNSEYFKIVGIKIFLDGVPEALTSWTKAPYTAEANKGDNYHGYIRWNDSRKNVLTAIIRKANENGLSVHMHSMGEGATEYALDCYESVRKALPGTEARNGLAHLSYLTDGDIARFAANGVIAYLAPHWASWKAGTKENEIKIYGEPKAKDMYRVKSFLDAGVHTSFHTDGMCNGGVPEMVYSAVTRKNAMIEAFLHSKNVTAEFRHTFNDGIRGEKEKLSALESLKCMAGRAAYAIKEEDNLGSIEVGKSADLCVYNKNLTDDKVMQDYRSVKAQLISVFSSGRLIYPFERKRQK